MELKPFAPAVIIPAYKSSLSLIEKQNLFISHKHNPSAHFVLLTYQGCELKEYSDILSNFETKIIPREYLLSVRAYNRLLKEEKFYKLFLDYEHILILQLDAVLVKNIKYINISNYDFIGAPWFPEFKLVKIFNDLHSIFFMPQSLCTKVSVGNGGLSIRKVDKFLEAAKILRDDISLKYSKKVPEDILFAYNKDILKLKYPKLEFAKNIFIEKCSVEKLFKTSPFGYHALHKYHKHQRKLILEEHLNDYEGESV